MRCGFSSYPKFGVYGTGYNESGIWWRIWRPVYTKYHATVQYRAMDTIFVASYPGYNIVTA